MIFAQQNDTKISSSDYLNGERDGEIKHEYIDGHIYAMSGASRNHNRISLNMASELRQLFKQANISCDVFSTDMKVKVSNPGENFFYPDVMVVCEPDDEDEYYQTAPVIIMEVLSKTTEKFDKSQKRLAYFKIPSLQEYVLIEQDKCEVTVFEKQNGWQPSYYFLGDEVSFKSIAMTLSVEDIYYQVENQEFSEFIANKETQAQASNES